MFRKKNTKELPMGACLVNTYIILKGNDGKIYIISYKKHLA